MQTGTAEQLAQGSLFDIEELNGGYTYSAFTRRIKELGYQYIDRHQDGRRIVETWEFPGKTPVLAFTRQRNDEPANEIAVASAARIIGLTPSQFWTVTSLTAASADPREEHTVNGSTPDHRDDPDYEASDLARDAYSVMHRAEGGTVWGEEELARTLDLLPSRRKQLGGVLSNLHLLEVIHRIRPKQYVFGPMSATTSARRTKNDKTLSSSTHTQADLIDYLVERGFGMNTIERTHMGTPGLLFLSPNGRHAILLQQRSEARGANNKELEIVRKALGLGPEDDLFGGHPAPLPKDMVDQPKRRKHRQNWATGATAQRVLDFLNTTPFQIRTRFEIMAALHLSAKEVGAAISELRVNSEIALIEGHGLAYISTTRLKRGTVKAVPVRRTPSAPRQGQPVQGDLDAAVAAFADGATSGLGHAILRSIFPEGAQQYCTTPEAEHEVRVWLNRTDAILGGLVRARIVQADRS